MSYKKYRKGVFVVVYAIKPLKYLILHRIWHWQGWEFTKGGFLAREKAEHAVVREVKEETGLKVLKIIPFNVKGSFIYDKEAQKDRKAKGFIYKLFAAEVKKGKVKITKKEHNAYKWVNFEKALKMLKWPNQKRCLRMVNNYLIKNSKKQ